MVESVHILRLTLHISGLYKIQVFADASLAAVLQLTLPHIQCKISQCQLITYCQHQPNMSNLNKEHSRLNGSNLQSLPSKYFKDLTCKWRWLNCCNFSQNIHRIIQLDKQATTDMSYPTIMKCEKDLYFLRLVNLHFLLKSSKVQVLFHLSKGVKKVWCLSVAQE